MKAKTETTQETLMVPINRNLLKAGNHPATILGASKTRNHNGKLNIELDCDLGDRRLQHNMYCTTPGATANTAKQLMNAFGLTSFKDLQSIVGQTCSLRIEHEEYKGRTQAKVSYVNKSHSSIADDESFDDLDDAFAETPELEIVL
jgi:hypothetical protein